MGVSHDYRGYKWYVWAELSWVETARELFVALFSVRVERVKCAVGVAADQGRHTDIYAFVITSSAERIETRLKEISMQQNSWN